MKTFKEYYWLAPALGAAATQLSRVSPQTLSQLPSQTYDKVKSGINTVKKVGSAIKNKYKKRVVKGIKTPKVNEKLTKIMMLNKIRLSFFIKLFHFFSKKICGNHSVPRISNYTKLFTLIKKIIIF